MSKPNSKALVYFFKIVLGRVLGFLFYALGAWWVIGTRAYIYFCYCVISSIAAGLYMMLRNPETFAERDKISPDTPVWDKVIVLVYWLLAFFGIYLIAGLEANNTLTLDATFWGGMFLCLFSSVLSLSAMAVNTFLESSARIQEDRGQSVVDNGVYSVIRHPTYAAILLWCVSVSLVFPTLFVWLTATVIATLIVVRTALEDKMLLENLDGYNAYAKRTRWRLIPFIW